LPGAAQDGPEARFGMLVDELHAAHPELPVGLIDTLARRHGTMTRALLEPVGQQGVAALGRCFGGSLYEREAAWCVEREWALSADDLLWRRTREGLHVDAEGRAALGAWLDAHLNSGR
jgi:glycerol-3-phosphate dehydrogenase